MQSDKNVGREMARIRTIKPEFPQSESIGRLTRESRLCFILLWTLADDSGRLRGNSRMLASLLYPYDDDAKKHIDGWIAELERESCIQRYQVEGETFIQICNWLKHQKIDKPSASKIPEIPEGFGEDSRILANPREGSEKNVADQGGDQGRDQGRDQGGEGSPKAHRLQIEVLPDSWRLWCSKDKPNLDPDRTFLKFKNYWGAKGGAAAKKVDWYATWQNWVMNENAPNGGNGNGNSKFNVHAAGRRLLAEALAAEALGDGPAPQVLPNVPE